MLITAVSSFPLFSDLAFNISLCIPSWNKGNETCLHSLQCTPLSHLGSIQVQILPSSHYFIDLLLSQDCKCHRQSSYDFPPLVFSHYQNPGTPIRAKASIAKFGLRSLISLVGPMHSNVAPFQHSTPVATGCQDCCSWGCCSRPELYDFVLTCKYSRSGA